MPSRAQPNRRRPQARAVALPRPPSLPVIDRDLLTAAVGLSLLAAALLLG